MSSASVSGRLRAERKTRKAMAQNSGKPVNAPELSEAERARMARLADAFAAGGVEEHNRRIRRAKLVTP